MKITTKKMDLARQLAGPALPEGAEVAGLITDASDERTNSALVLMRTGLYVSMIAGVTRTIDQRRTHMAVMGAAGGAKAKNYSAPEIALRKQRLAAARLAR